MNQEIAPKAQAALAKSQGSWGSEGVDTKDILIPKLLLMQPLSELVSEGKASPGAIVRSTTGEALATKDKPLSFIAFSSFKTWILSEQVKEKYEFRGVEPMTAGNVNEPLEWMVNGSKWRRDRSLNFYVLLPQDVAREAAALKKLQESGELPDPEDALLPCVLSFRRTSYGAGKDLATHFAKASHFNVPPAVTVFKLFASLEKNDKGSYYVFKIEKDRKSTDEEVQAAHKWYETTKVQPVEVDDSDLERDGGPAVATKVADDAFEAEVAKTF